MRPACRRDSVRQGHQRRNPQLEALDVGPEVPVVVCLDRRAELIVSLLAVLEAGGVYVPVDPSYPRERVGFTLDDSGARAVITRDELVELLPAEITSGDSDTALIRIDQAVDAVPRSRDRRRTSTENLAYLIYTSGSTGRPKGVAISHHSAVAMVTWAHGVFSREETAYTLGSTSVCFDLSVYEIFVPLSRGDALVLADNALDLPALPAADRVTLVNTVPSTLRELLRDGQLPPSVRTVNLAGEALPQDLVDRAYEEPGVADVYNLYGPSEDTTYSTYGRMHAGEPPPIGRPVANTRAYVLDTELRPTPRGVAGELYLAGDGLARGYFGRPELTADRFVPDPFVGEVAELGCQAGARMYRTGDLVVYDADSVLHYLGRLDHQVKLRGFRIELGEIEALLAGDDSVAAACAIVREDEPGDQRLVAYVTRADGHESVDPPALRALVGETLPGHMVPSTIVVLDALPLTPNGKTDRKALPAPEWSGTTYRPPETVIEGLVARSFAEVLKVGSVGL
ncbi:MAG: amino acid adenylation domain-containing protein, partial [Acidobacteriota bacterium]